jgi:class 3 adenylate cyclase
MVQEQPVRVERRLSAILAADAAGYSRLMHNDKEATHAKLTALLTDAVAPAIAGHGGRIVKNTGVCTENLIRVDDAAESLKLAA